MTLPTHIQQNYEQYTSRWPILNFFNALVHDPELAKSFEQANPAGRVEILEFFGLGPEHLSLFTPSGNNRPLSDADIRKILDAAREQILDDMPSNFW